ncbi:MAG: hypothetical protein GY770_34725 [Aestuariibacter sp.]|nr:hypothetical protein [Aestuariibacter sp.]
MKNSYDVDGEWERELFIESFSFAASAGVGVVALSILTVATPVGWVLLIAGTAAASMGMNHLIKENSGNWYDAIMKSLN